MRPGFCINFCMDLTQAKFARGIQAANKSLLQRNGLFLSGDCTNGGRVLKKRA